MVRRDRRICHRLGAWLSDLSCYGRQCSHRFVRWRHEAPATGGYRSGRRIAHGIQVPQSLKGRGQQGGKTQKVIAMALTRNFKKTVVARVERDPAFAKALLDEAATLFLSDEPETARVILRDLVNSMLGVQQLAQFRSPTRAHPRG